LSLCKNLFGHKIVKKKEKKFATDFVFIQVFGCPFFHATTLTISSIRSLKKEVFFTFQLFRYKPRYSFSLFKEKNSFEYCKNQSVARLYGIVKS